MLHHFHVWFLMLSHLSVCLSLSYYKNFSCRIQFTPFTNGQTYTHVKCRRKIAIWHEGNTPKMSIDCDARAKKEQTDFPNSLKIFDMKYAFILNVTHYLIFILHSYRIQVLEQWLFFIRIVVFFFFSTMQKVTSRLYILVETSLKHNISHFWDKSFSSKD